MYILGIIVSLALFQLGLFLLNNEPGGVGADTTDE